MVSIILPTYNRAHLIINAITSVLQQTYTYFELLIIDDGSADNTEQVISSINDNRIRYYKFSHEGRIGKLKNFAVQQSKGEFIAFIDSDDLWVRNKLEKQIQLFIKSPLIGFCITDVTTMRNGEILIDHSYKLQKAIEYKNIFEDLNNGRMLVYNPTLILRKECFNKTGYFNEQMMCGGHDFVMRLSYYFDAGIIYENLVLRRVHDSNISEIFHFENYNEYIETYNYLYKHKMINLFQICKAKSNAFLKMGKIYSSNGNKRKAISNYISSLKYGLPVPLHFLRLWHSLMLVKHK